MVAWCGFQHLTRFATLQMRMPPMQVLERLSLFVFLQFVFLHVFVFLFLFIPLFCFVFLFGTIIVFSCIFEPFRCDREAALQVRERLHLAPVFLPPDHLHCAGGAGVAPACETAVMRSSGYRITCAGAARLPSAAAPLH